MYTCHTALTVILIVNRWNHVTYGTATCDMIWMVSIGLSYTSPRLVYRGHRDPYYGPFVIPKSICTTRVMVMLTLKWNSIIFCSIPQENKRHATCSRFPINVNITWYVEGLSIVITKCSHCI